MKPARHFRKPRPRSRERAGIDNNLGYYAQLLYEYGGIYLCISIFKYILQLYKFPYTFHISIFDPFCEVVCFKSQWMSQPRLQTIGQGATTRLPELRVNFAPLHSQVSLHSSSPTPRLPTGHGCTVHVSFRFQICRSLAMAQASPSSWILDRFIARTWVRKRPRTSCLRDYYRRVPTV